MQDLVDKWHEGSTENLMNFGCSPHVACPLSQIINMHRLTTVSSVGIWNNYMANLQLLHSEQKVCGFLNG